MPNKVLRPPPYSWQWHCSVGDCGKAFSILKTLEEFNAH